MFSQKLVNKSSLVCLLCVFLSFTSVSQELKRKPLSEILTELQVRFNISFSYQDADIVGLSLFSPAEGKTIEESLEFLSTQSGLSFQKLDSEFVAVVKPKEPVKVICGFIKAADKPGPLVNATIEGQENSTASDLYGFFSLESVDDGDSISIRHLGYQTQYLIKSELFSGCITIVMIPSISSLPEVTIFNYFTRGIDRTIDGTLVIHPKNQQLLPGMTESDVLYSIQALPGIQSVDETVSNINIRGGTNDQNLVLWEGIRMFQTGHFFGLISAFNPHFNDQIRITTNGTPARYGHATSGTIDMRSSDEIPEKISGSAGLGLNMINGDVNLRVPLSAKTVLKFSARRAITDVIQTPTFDRYFERAFENTEVISTSQSTTPASDHSFRFYDISSRLNQQISTTDNLSLSFIAVSNNLEFEESQQGSTALNSKTSTLGQKNIATGIAYNKAWSPKHSTSLSSSFSNYQLHSVNFDLTNDQRLVQKNEVLNYNLKAISTLTLKNLDIEAGIEFDEIGIQNFEDINNPDFRRLIKEVVTSYSGFTQGSYKHKDLTFTLGARGNYYKDLDRFLFEPRLSLAKKVTPELSIELLGELKSQLTTQVIDLQTDFLGVEKRRWVLSNGQDVPIVMSKNISTGAQYKSSGFLFSATGYLREVDGITTSGQGFLNAFQLIRESGSYRVKGLTLLLSYSFLDFTTWLNTSYLKNDYTFPQLTPVEFPSNFDIRNSASAGISYDNGPLELSAGLSSRSGRPFTAIGATEPLVDGEINYESPNSSRLDSYFRLDLSANYQFKLSQKVNGHLGGSLWNLTNRTNTLSRYYQLVDGDVLALQQKALALTPNMVFRITF